LDIRHAPNVVGKDCVMLKNEPINNKCSDCLCCAISKGARSKWRGRSGGGFWGWWRRRGSR